MAGRGTGQHRRQAELRGFRAAGGGALRDALELPILAGFQVRDTRDRGWKHFGAAPLERLPGLLARGRESLRRGGVPRARLQLGDNKPRNRSEDDRVKLRAGSFFHGQSGGGEVELLDGGQESLAVWAWAGWSR